MDRWTTWDRLESGPANAARTVLLLPGGMCSAAMFEEVMAEPTLADVRLVAVTLPGHAGTPAPDDTSIETYSERCGELARDLQCDAVVGFSMGANVALEMVGSEVFRGPVVLLAPAFSRVDEAVFLRLLDRLGTVLGHWPCSLMRRMIGLAVKDAPVPADRKKTLAEMLRSNEARFMRRGIHSYLRYLDEHGSVAPRLRDAGVATWVVHGETGDGGVTAEERTTLTSSPNITMITLPGKAFFIPNEQPSLVADLIVQALAASAPEPPQSPAAIPSDQRD
jgi:pimeloyl-ACP methyl ester carboxylesterase